MDKKTPKGVLYADDLDLRLDSFIFSPEVYTQQKLPSHSLSVALVVDRFAYDAIVFDRHVCTANSWSTSFSHIDQKLFLVYKTFDSEEQKLPFCD